MPSREFSRHYLNTPGLSGRVPRPSGQHPARGTLVSATVQLEEEKRARDALCAARANAPVALTDLQRCGASDLEATDSPAHIVTLRRTHIASTPAQRPQHVARL